jgi:1-acyl-sn-glycerol-3-phosphate acyltransferase
MAVAPHDERARALLRILTEFSEESRIRPPAGGIGLETRLEADLGLDSLSRAEVLARVERGLGVRLPEEALLAPTPRDLLALAEVQGAAVGERAPPPLVEEPEGHEAGAPEGAATLVEVLEWHLARHPDRTHILYYGAEDEPTAITYRGLVQGARRVAELLRGEGLDAGDRIAVMLPTSPGYFFSFFGILLAGGIPVPIYPPARPEQIEDHLRRHARILENAGARFLITVPRARAVARLLRVQVPSLKGVLTLDGMKSGSEEETDLAGLARPAAHDIAFLQYTSGSTGQPKGVVLSHADLLANIRAMGEAAQVRPDDVFVSWLPLYHDMGLIGAWFGTLYYGLRLVSLSPLAFLASPLRWLQAIDRHRGTLSAAPNFAYELCLKRVTDADLERLDLSSWRCAFNGAEPVSAQTLRRFAARFAPCGLAPEALAPVYGLAEAAVGLAFPPPGRGARIDCIDRARFARAGHALPVPCDDPSAMEVVACGRPLPGYRVRVVDGSGRELPDRHEGLLQFQGPSATRGYYRNPEATARLIRDGWHDTGDRAYLAGGDIHLTGRVKDLIIRGGRNIYPYELEEAVGGIPGVRKGCVAAFAAADLRTGTERLVIAAETRERDPQRRRELEGEVRARATDILGMPPDEVALVPPRAVPKTSSGKLRRTSARDLYLQGRLREGPPSPVRQLVRVGLAGVWASLKRGLGRLPAWLYGAYVWLLVVVIAPVVWAGVITLPAIAWRWVLVRSAIGLLRRLAGVRLTVEGAAWIPPARRPFVLVANHQSYLDALALIEAVPRPLAFVAKQELGEGAFLGVFLKRLGTLFVDRFDLHRGAGESERLGAHLGAGLSLAFFPEGTFRDDPGLLPFRMGAFVSAAAQGLPVLPVAIAGTRRILTGESMLPRRAPCEVQIGEPLIPAATDWSEAVRLRDGARDFILAKCGEPDLSADGSI